MDLSKLYTAFGYTFRDPSLLEAALMHRSYVHENVSATLPSNERLEFLGDALLNFITGSFLYHTYAELGEGQLTTTRSALVQTRTLAKFARGFGLGEYVRISKGEERARARQRDNLLADTFEAVLAAIAIDGGWEAARDWVLPLLRAEMENGVAERIDYKSALQHRVQGAVNVTPSYRERMVTGPDHERQWTIEVWADRVLLGVGQGASKPLASQEAARVALEALDEANSALLPLLGSAT